MNDNNQLVAQTRSLPHRKMFPGDDCLTRPETDDDNVLPKTQCALITTERSNERIPAPYPCTAPIIAPSASGPTSKAVPGTISAVNTTKPPDASFLKLSGCDGAMVEFASLPKGELAILLGSGGDSTLTSDMVGINRSSSCKADGDLLVY